MDFTVTHHGSISILTPLTPAAREWLEENVDLEEAMRWGPGGIAVDHHYIVPLMQGIDGAGLSLGPL
jgi:hypothetical protein